MPTLLNYFKHAGQDIMLKIEQLSKAMHYMTPITGDSGIDILYKLNTVSKIS